MKTDIPQKPHQDAQVRGPALRDKMNESEQYGNDYRSTHKADETQGTQTGHKKSPEKKEAEAP